MNMRITTEDELEELLSRPTEADVECMASMDGDIVILGVGGKMGPSLARLVRRAVDEAGSSKRVIGVSRFSEPGLAAELQSAGISTISCDLLERSELEKLPNVPNVIYMAARKFGTTGSEHLTWAMNTLLPAFVAERFKESRIVAFSTGNVYPLVPVSSGGATESTRVEPVGEYAQSALGRERMFEYASARWKSPVTLLRLNYAVELRYGVLVDIGRAVFERCPVDLHMGFVNVIWQRDANSVCLRALGHCQSPPRILNVTGPAILSVRSIAEEFGKRFGIPVAFTGEEAPTALLSNAAECHRLFGLPTVTPTEMIELIADWVSAGAASLGKPTHYQTRNGRF